MDYYACLMKKSQLLYLSSKYHQFKNSTASAANSSRGYWQGTANDAFLNKISEINYAASQISNEMQDVAQLIQRAAIEVMMEEMAARAAAAE